MYHNWHKSLGNVYNELISPHTTLRGEKVMFHYPQNHNRWEYVVEDGKIVLLKWGKRIIPIVKRDWQNDISKKMGKSY
jgi:hypothetical protein